MKLVEDSGQVGVQALDHFLLDGLGNVAIEGLGDAAGDAGEGVGVAAEGDGVAEGIFKIGGILKRR